MINTRMRLRALWAGVAVALVAPTVNAQDYFQVATLPELLGPGNSGFLDTVVADGDDYYAFGRLFGSVAGSGDSLTKFSGGTSTVLVDDTEWSAVSTNQLAGFYGARVVGDDLFFVNFFDNGFYSVDTTSGAITTIATPAGASFTSNYAIGPDGTAYAYESGVDEILKIETDGTTSVEVTNAELVAALGTDLVSGGFEVVGNELYVARDSTNNIVAYDLTTGVASNVFSSAAAVETVTVDSDGDIDFEDIFYAPDGLVYFYEDDSDAILSFDPSDPDGTITQVLSEAQLNAGPGTDNVDQFSWLNGGLAWTDQDDFNDVGGYFTLVPEPTSAGLLAFTAIAALRRRRVAG